MEQREAGRFLADLKSLVVRAERTGRPSLATAIRAILRDWQSRPCSVP